MLPIPGEIFLRVINDMICANRAHHVQVPRAAYAGDFGSECFGELHRKRTHATRGAVNQNLLPGVDVPRIAQALQSGDGRHRNGGGLLERTIGRFQRHPVFRNGCVLGKTPRPCSEDLIS